MTLQRWLASLALLLFACTSVHARLPGGISGTWFNPDQSGHGLSINLVDVDRAVVIWHVYDLDGNPLTLYIEGDVHGRRIDGVAFAARGMRFGSFDPAELQMDVWGDVDIEFDDCLGARLSWNARDPFFGSGDMQIARLAFVAEVGCDLPPPNGLRPGLYSGSLNSHTHGGLNRGVGIVDLEGRLWGIERAADGDRLALPGGWSFGFHTVVRARPTAADASGVDAAVRIGFNIWSGSEGGGGAPFAASGRWSIETPASAEFAVDAQVEQRWAEGAPAGTTLVAPITLAALAGEYRFLLTDQFGQRQAVLRVHADGSACINLDELGTWQQPPTGCHFSGRLRVPEGEAGLIDFELSADGNPELAPYRGRGWLAEVDGSRELVLVGDNGVGGFGLVGR